MKFLLLALASIAVLGARAVAPDADLHGVAHVGGQPAPNIVVWLDASGAARPRQTAKVVLDQRNLSFFPHVLAVRVGTTIDFPNHDRVFHNVFSFRDGKVFDLGMYPVGTTRPETFDKAGVSRVFCNIHPNMAAYVVAVDSPYFAVSDESGAFTLPAVPADRHTYHAWRVGAPELSGMWTPGGPGAAPSTLTIEWPR